ncbi:hypothetical protein CDAR_63101 [Caerostris darwini]|uniref:Uncharacterized protein n=1 Tax=Caerostris darwini TaxID=1538125 RepID=A0AAV4UFZ9_9ARAC|nr:hypothetical protein CDAR_63101 [Caerostris darwini]
MNQNGHVNIGSKSSFSDILQQFCCSFYFIFGRASVLYEERIVLAHVLWNTRPALHKSPLMSTRDKGKKENMKRVSVTLAKERERPCPAAEAAAAVNQEGGNRRL